MTIIIDTLVVSGGGLDGFAALGSLSALRDEHMTTDIRTVVGTSIGSFVGALFCMDVDLRLAFRTMYRMNRKALLSASIDNLSKTFGFDDGSGLDTIIATFVPETLTFRGIRAEYGRDLFVHAACISDGVGVTFGPETHPDFSVRTAIRMSCSVPLAFSGIWNDAKLYVDGCLTNNYPLDLVPNPRAKILGIRLRAPSPGTTPPTTTKIDTIKDFLEGMLRTVWSSTQNARKKPTLEILIPPNTPLTLFYDVSNEHLVRLYNIGYAKGKLLAKKVA